MKFVDIDSTCPFPARKIWALRDFTEFDSFNAVCTVHSNSAKLKVPFDGMKAGDNGTASSQIQS